MLRHLRQECCNPCPHHSVDFLQHGRHAMNEPPKQPQNDEWPEPFAGVTSTPPKVKCTQCEKEFSSLHGMRVHAYQAHIRGGGNRRKHLTPEQRRESRRIYQAKLRQRRKDRGLTSKGTPIKQPKHWTRNRKLTGTKWSPEHRANFMATIQRKAAEQKQPPPQHRKIEPFVLRAEDVEPAAPTTIKFCPHCGSNLQKYL